MKAYLVGIKGYDTHSVKFVTMSVETSIELFEILRKGCIEECKDMIDHDIREGYDSSSWVLMAEQLNKMKPGNIDEDGSSCGDRPFIEVHPIVTDASMIHYSGFVYCLSCEKYRRPECPYPGRGSHVIHCEEWKQKE
jgi:hypothetical protein